MKFFELVLAGVLAVINRVFPTKRNHGDGILHKLVSKLIIAVSFIAAVVGGLVLFDGKNDIGVYVALSAFGVIIFLLLAGLIQRIVWSFQDRK